MPSKIEWKADAGGRVTHVTRGWQDVTGQPVDDALGDGWGDVVHPADLGTLTARWQEDVGRVVPFAATFRVLTRTGDAVWMESHGSPITRDGRVVEWVGWCSPLLQQGCATLPVRCITGCETAEPKMGQKRGRYQVAIVEVHPGWMPRDWNDAPHEAVVSRLEKRCRSIGAAEGFTFGFNDPERFAGVWAVILDGGPDVRSGDRCIPRCTLFAPTHSGPAAELQHLQQPVQQH